MDNRSHHPYRSLFWPVLLIGAGVILLFSNLGIIPGVNFLVLLRLWPLLLIVAGLDLLVGRRYPLVGAIIGILAVTFALVILLAGPALGLVRSAQTVTERFQEPLGEATRASITLDLSYAPSTIQALPGGENLFDATITHFGEVEMAVSGEDPKEIRLVSGSTGFNWFDTLGSGDPRWEIGLNNQIPLELVIDGGSGSSRIDLVGLKLAGLSMDAGSGSIDLALPQSENPYNAAIEGGSASLDLTAQCGKDLEVRLDGGSGSMTIDLPENCPARVEVLNSGSGSVGLPNWLQQVEDGDDDEGAWETAEFTRAGDSIVVVVEDIGSGSFSVR
jgi:hypothetical protein